MIEKTFDEIIVERLKRSAIGFPYSNGQPISRLDRFLAQGALTSRAVRGFGGISLYSLINGLHTEAEIHDSNRTGLLGWNMYLPGGAVETYHSTAMRDIASGRLVVREPLNFLRCNELQDLQILPDLSPGGMEAMAIMVRYAVKKSEAVAWLDWHGIDIPGWLGGSGDQPEEQDSPCSGEEGKAGFSMEEARELWSDCLGGGKVKLRQMFDAIQIEIEGRGYSPMCIPHGGIASIGLACKAEHPKLFNAKSSFDNAWRELVDRGKVRSYNHVAYGGKIDGNDQNAGQNGIDA